ncbi:hypothetical protein [Natronorubrum sp. FCH18a]|uniref:hypothetical protein n=1 Tax=Natronorubrum sp. FCH18a TaxID=3447018 RepID=UPI003F5118CF
MGHKYDPGDARRRRLLSRRLHEIEERLETVERRADRLENTLQGVVREATSVSLGGPCRCGESLLIVRRQTIYCPQCQYRRTI